MGRRTRAIGVLIGLIGCGGEPTGTPRDVAEGVHHRGGYPDELEIVDSEGAALPEVGFGPGAEGSANAGPAGAAPPGNERVVKRRVQGKPPPRPKPRPVPASPPIAHERSEPGIVIPHLFGAIGHLLSILLLLGAIMLVALIAVWVASRWLGRAAPARAARPQPREGTASAEAEPTEADAHALANQGRYDEAIRVLLLRSLRRAGWTPGGRGSSCTARDVLRGLGLGDARRGPLDAIVRLAEDVRFGGRAATAERFSEMLRSFRELELESQEKPA